jgi:kojibiose phosphorylase
MNLWNIEQNSYESSKNKIYETIFTLANGYRGLRGSLEFSKEGQIGNFISGIYDKWTEDVPEIVNCPNPLGLDIYFEDEKIDLDENKLLEFTRHIDMQKGILKLQFIIELSEEKMVRIETERFVSRHNIHRWGAKYTIQPLNFGGKFYVESTIDGNSANKAHDVKNRVKHYKVEKLEDLGTGIVLQSATMDSKYSMVEITSLKLSETVEGSFAGREFVVKQEQVSEKYELNIKSEQTYTFYKCGVTYTNRDTDNILEAAKEDYEIFSEKGYKRELNDHINAWFNIWEDIDVKIEGDEVAQRAIRFNLFHLSSSAYSGDSKVSIGAKALHGEGYRGHIFWDTETFMLPFFIFTQPEVAKSLLMYRYNTLESAKENAGQNGFKGAQYPWESADTGAEVTPKWGINFDGSVIKIYTGDEEFHINSDIVYAVIQYYKATYDVNFMINYGLKIIFETSKFWKSRVEYNQKEDRYEVNTVIGPDEFHEHVNNNAYTNCLAKWSMKNAVELAQWIKNKDSSTFVKLCEETDIDEEEIKSWKAIEEKIYIPSDKESKIIEQFEGYLKLEDIIIKNYDNNGMPLWPENIEIKNLSKTQLVKQADIVMLLFLLNEEFDNDTKKLNYEYYEKRTMHKSSLSPSIYSILGLKVGDTKNAYKYFMKTALTDLEDNQSNTAEGLHAAATGGAWQSVIFGFAGMNIETDGTVSFNPWLPEQWSSLSFNLKLKGNVLQTTIEKEKIVLTCDGEINVKVNGEDYLLTPGETISVTMLSI